MNIYLATKQREGSETERHAFFSEKAATDKLNELIVDTMTTLVSGKHPASFTIDITPDDAIVLTAPGVTPKQTKSTKVVNDVTYRFETFSLTVEDAKPENQPITPAETPALPSLPHTNPLPYTTPYNPNLSPSCGTADWPQYNIATAVESARKVLDVNTGITSPSSIPKHRVLTAFDQYVKMDDDEYDQYTNELHKAISVYGHKIGKFVIQDADALTPVEMKSLREKWESIPDEKDATNASTLVLFQLKNLSVVAFPAGAKTPAMLL